MITIEKMLSYEINNLSWLADSLHADDIDQLIKWLGEKDDTIRYSSFLLLQERSREHNDVYPYWDVFLNKLHSSNSYQRSIGLMLMAENAKWDKEGRFDEAIDFLLSFCDDEKPITVRQCIQSLCKVVPYKRHLCAKIAHKLVSIEIMKRKETQRKILLLDILNVLIAIKKQEPADKIDIYISNAMTGEILDKKAKREILKLM
ncbi:hypothetical protein SAMN05660649_03492 [Desulfotomaculum arcticum]|uniref:HEAT repeat-containing protein n=1 Tax=Desulfotruncus arcticus DSM 17038 TaxID=1121424 RepID=A0A1I2WGC5_9FIRM|nr:hypothetical protein [Desulfotruncus arcticus]SFH00392.1 hypothetical protein SAMN05660649_03492 [Desulfotomaculum arcticum] [Desulfotruncus arcticus DSM 17038]